MKYRFIFVSMNFGQTQYFLFLGKVMPNFCMTLMHGYNSFAYTTHAMKVGGRMVDRYLGSAVADMYQNRRSDIKCQCRRCKEVIDRPPANCHISMMTQCTVCKKHAEDMDHALIGCVRAKEIWSNLGLHEIISNAKLMRRSGSELLEVLPCDPTNKRILWM